MYITLNKYEYFSIAAIFDPHCSQTDNAMISVYPFGDQLYAFNECPIIHRINTESLSTECQVDVSNYVSIVHHTSHPHVMQDGKYDVYHVDYL